MILTNSQNNMEEGAVDVSLQHSESDILASKGEFRKFDKSFGPLLTYCPSDNLVYYIGYEKSASAEVVDDDLVVGTILEGGLKEETFSRKINKFGNAFIDPWTHHDPKFKGCLFLGDGDYLEVKEAVHPFVDWSSYPAIGTTQHRGTWPNETEYYDDQFGLIHHSLYDENYLVRSGITSGSSYALDSESTIEFWMRSNTGSIDPDNQRILSREMEVEAGVGIQIGKMATRSTIVQWGVSVLGGYIAFLWSWDRPGVTGMVTETLRATSTKVSDGNWHHVAIVLNTVPVGSSTAGDQIYIDGVSQSKVYSGANMMGTMYGGDNTATHMTSTRVEGIFHPRLPATWQSGRDQPKENLNLYIGKTPEYDEFDGLFEGGPHYGNWGIWHERGFEGHLNELRISQTAKYKTNFTAPPSPFSGTYGGATNVPARAHSGGGANSWSWVGYAPDLQILLLQSTGEINPRTGDLGGGVFEDHSTGCFNWVEWNDSYGSSHAEWEGGFNTEIGRPQSRLKTRTINTHGNVKHDNTTIGPYGNLGAIYFDGNGDFLEIPAESIHFGNVDDYNNFRYNDGSRVGPAIPDDDLVIGHQLELWGWGQDERIIEFWWKHNSHSSAGHTNRNEDVILSKGFSDSAAISEGEGGWAVKVSQNGRLSFTLYTNSSDPVHGGYHQDDIISSKKIDDGEWHHIVIMHGSALADWRGNDQAGINLYIDGAPAKEFDGQPTDKTKFWDEDIMPWAPVLTSMSDGAPAKRYGYMLWARPGVKNIGAGEPLRVGAGSTSSGAAYYANGWLDDLRVTTGSYCCGEGEEFRRFYPLEGEYGPCMSEPLILSYLEKEANGTITNESPYWEQDRLNNHRTRCAEYAGEEEERGGGADEYGGGTMGGNMFWRWDKWSWGEWWQKSWGVPRSDEELERYRYRLGSGSNLSPYWFPKEQMSWASGTTALIHFDPEEEIDIEDPIGGGGGVIEDKGNYGLCTFNPLTLGSENVYRFNDPQYKAEAISPDCDYSVEFSLNWSDVGTSVNPDLDIYAKVSDGDAVYYGNTSETGNKCGGDEWVLELNHDAHPGCAATPLPPEKITGRFDENKTFYTWYGQHSDCTDELGDSNVTKSVKFTNHSKTSSMRVSTLFGGDIGGETGAWHTTIPANSSYVFTGDSPSTTIAYAGHDTDENADYENGTKYKVDVCQTCGTYSTSGGKRKYSIPRDIIYSAHQNCLYLLFHEHEQWYTYTINPFIPGGTNPYGGTPGTTDHSFWSDTQFSIHKFDLRSRKVTDIQTIYNLKWDDDAFSAGFYTRNLIKTVRGLANDYYHYPEFLRHMYISLSIDPRSGETIALHSKRGFGYSTYSSTIRTDASSIENMDTVRIASEEVKTDNPKDTHGICVHSHAAKDPTSVLIEDYHPMWVRDDYGETWHFTSSRDDGSMISTALNYSSNECLKYSAGNDGSGRNFISATYPKKLIYSPILGALYNSTNVDTTHIQNFYSDSGDDLFHQLTPDKELISIPSGEKGTVEDGIYIPSQGKLLYLVFSSEITDVSMNLVYVDPHGNEVILTTPTLSTAQSLIYSPSNDRIYVLGADTLLKIRPHDLSIEEVYDAPTGAGLAGGRGLKSFIPVYSHVNDVIYYMSNDKEKQSFCFKPNY